MTITKSLSVAMPVYNEEACIKEAVAEIRRCVLDLVLDAELIVVNDGSKDRTGAILDQIAADDARVRVIHQPNGGHGRALRTGLDAARGEYLFLIDSDRQIPLEAFAGLWEEAQHRDGAFGIRVKRNDPRLRLLLTRVVRRSLMFMFGARIFDANTPFKVIRRQVWEEARRSSPRTHLLHHSFWLFLPSVRDEHSLSETCPTASAKPESFLSDAFLGARRPFAGRPAAIGTHGHIFPGQVRRLEVRSEQPGSLFRPGIRVHQSSGPRRWRR
jgi:glycosyltransferase involved in cell wall biosynthesis